MIENAVTDRQTLHLEQWRIRELDTPDATLKATDLLRTISGGVETVVPSDLLRAVQHTGGYVFGAYDEASVMLAVSVGFLANEGLHCHITGVAPNRQRRGLGLALKRHQRAWCLERGITRVTWTCDPLVRRDVTFSLHALGATVVKYLPDHYGPMNDGVVNGGDESDRFELHWDLLSQPAADAEQSRLPWVESSAPLAVAESADGLPVVEVVCGAARRVQLPPDIETIRRVDPQAGQAWRMAVREAVRGGLSAGAVITGVTAEGALVLEPTRRRRPG